MQPFWTLSKIDTINSDLSVPILSTMEYKSENCIQICYEYS